MNNLEDRWTFVPYLPSNRCRQTRISKLLDPRRDLCTEERPRATRELDVANLVNFSIDGETTWTYYCISRRLGGSCLIVTAINTFPLNI